MAKRRKVRTRSEGSTGRQIEGGKSDKEGRIMVILKRKQTQGIDKNADQGKCMKYRKCAKAEWGKAK